MYILQVVCLKVAHIDVFIFIFLNATKHVKTLLRPLKLCLLIVINEKDKTMIVPK